MKLLWLLSVIALTAYPQEADAGLDFHGTITGAAGYSHALAEPPRNGQPITGGFQALLYPTVKLGSHWTFSGAVQVHSRPYYREQYSTIGEGVKADILQANLAYTRFWEHGSLNVRVGQMTSAFGSFLLRYDPSANPLIDIPPQYGYYYKPVTSLGLMGAQVDVTVRSLDFRGQFVNSSPANRRSIFDHDQYGNWTGGVGYTVRQGFRVGVSAFRGPYLHRQYPYFFPGEAAPKEMPATAVGVDVQWGAGPWNASGEWQRFVMHYAAIPNYAQQFGYVELKRTLTPRWYAATRLQVTHAIVSARNRSSVRFAAGYPAESPSDRLKLGTKFSRGNVRGTLANSAVIQLVTTFHAPPLAFK